MALRRPTSFAAATGRGGAMLAVVAAVVLAMMVAPAMAQPAEVAATDLVRRTKPGGDGAASAALDAGPSPAPPAAKRNRGSSEAVSNLCYVLIQTCVALGAGYASVSTGILNGQGDDMKAIRFIVGRISLPLMTFNVIATASISDVDWGIVAACNLGKVFGAVLAGVISFIFFRSRSSRGHRFVTAALFAFFQVTSNDLAIGIPIMQALYGDETAGYMAANILVFQLIYTPLVLVCLEVADSLMNRRLAVDGEGGPQNSPAWNACVGVARNPVVQATVAGTLYYVFLAGTRETIDGKQYQLPHPLYDVVTIMLQPFKCLFLFLNGACLSTIRLSRWSWMLVVFKVMICPFVTYILTQALMEPTDEDTKRKMLSFSFYYGTVPTGGAPLVYALQYAPGIVEDIAGGCLWAVILAAPVEFMSALVLGSGQAAGPDLLNAAQLVVSTCSCVCGALFVLHFALTFRFYDSFRRIIAFLCTLSTLYAVVACLILREFWTCRESIVHLFGFLQASCNFITVYLHILMVFGWRGGGLQQVGGVCGVMALALVQSLFVPVPHTMRELCGYDLSVDHLSRTTGLDITLLLVHFVLFGVSAVAKRRRSRRTDLLEARVPPSGNCQMKAPNNAATTLAVLQCMRLLLESITSTTVAVWTPAQGDAFIPMFILVNTLELGQSCWVLMLVVLSSSFRPHTKHMMEMFRKIPDAPEVVVLGSFAPSTDMVGRSRSRQDSEADGEVVSFQTSIISMEHRIVSRTPTSGNGVLI